MNGVTRRKMRGTLRPIFRPHGEKHPMATFTDYLKQIEDLQRKAETARKEEVAAVVADIKAKIRAFGLTAADLGLTVRAARPGPPRAAAAKPAGGGRKARAAKTAKGRGAKRRIKYRGPGGEAWSGVGRKPKWVEAALAAGRSLAEFEVK
jgi:DNA-binding protein H-NS